MGAFCGKTSEQVVADAVATLNDEKAFSGKVAIVTGPLAGIGRYTCFTLAGLGVKVVLAGRQKKRLEALASEIRAQHPQANVYPLELDLSSLASVRQFAEEFKALDLPLHYLINNAAVMACPYTVSSDGYELQYATNFLGHFLLTELLIPVLKKSAPARIVNVSSRGHLFAKANAEQPEIRKQDYNPWVSYGNSKLYNIWYASELNRRLQGTNVTAYSLHPGSIPTELGRHNLIAHVAYSIAGKCMKSISQGASTTLYCTLSPDVELLAGGYFADCKPATPSETALNVKNAETLYNGSLALLGIKSSI